MGLSFQYFLRLTHEPKYNTLTWTLDYSKSSDFGGLFSGRLTSITTDRFAVLDLDDNVGHWQVMPHPSKRLAMFLSCCEYG